MALQSTCFYLFAALAIASAVLTITRRDVVQSAIFLVSTLLATGGIFLQLNAELLFAAQILLYAGGVVTLFVFVMMLCNPALTIRQAPFNRRFSMGVILAAILGVQLLLAIFAGRRIFSFSAPPVTALPPNSGEVGRVLFQGYLLPFEMSAVLLLVAMVGVIVMSRRRV